MALPLFTRCRAISISTSTSSNRHVSSHYPSSSTLPPPPSALPLLPRTNPPSITISISTSTSTSPSITIPSFPQSDHPHPHTAHPAHPDRVHHDCQDPSMTLYDVLQIPPTATLAEVKASFRRLARLYHPDALARRGAGAGQGNSTQHFLRIHAAYIALSDPQIRARYDLQLHFQTCKSDYYTLHHCGPKVGRQDVGAHDYARYPIYGQSMRPGRRWETDQCW